MEDLLWDLSGNIDIYLSLKATFTQISTSKRKYSLANCGKFTKDSEEKMQHM